MKTYARFKKMKEGLSWCIGQAVSGKLTVRDMDYKIVTSRIFESNSCFRLFSTFLSPSLKFSFLC